MYGEQKENCKKIIIIKRKTQSGKIMYDTYDRKRVSIYNL